MKILLLNASEQTGGAAVACKRLMQSLNKNGIEAKMLVRDKQTNDDSVFSVNSVFNFVRFVWERFVIWINNNFSRKNLFAVSIANTGSDISSHPLVKWADVIHLHWINQGFLSLKSIENLIATGKPIVWTMHDMWPCTSICHHARECNKYYTGCYNCQFINNGKKEHDLSYNYFFKKKRLNDKCSISYVACSGWLGNRASRSAFVDAKQINVIPNPINTEVFQPENRKEARKKTFNIDIRPITILFGSVKNTDKRKGIIMSL